MFLKTQRNSLAVVDLSSLVSHCKSLVVAAAVNSGDVTDVSVEDDFEVRLFSEVVEVHDEIFASRKQLPRVGSEAFGGVIVVHVSDERVPVVTKIELDVRFAGVTFVDAEQRVVPRISLKEAACSHTRVELNHGKSGTYV